MFRKKYECEFLRLETLDPAHMNHLDIQDRSAKLNQYAQASSVQSSVYRSLSMASQSDGQLDHMTLLKNLQEENGEKPDRLKTTASIAETTNSTQVQNS